MANVELINVKAFLTMLSVSEDTSTSPATKCNGYDVIVTGKDGKREIFTDFSTHPFAGGRPAKVLNSRGLASTASGRYQHLVKHWEHYKKLLQLPDFGPESQDKWAIQLIKECRALEDVKAGRIELAISKCRNIWASLPGAGYGQREHNVAFLLDAYRRAGGILA